MTAAALTWPRRLRRAWDRATIYLPIALMGLLALGSYWLLRVTPEPDTQAAPRAPQHEPDYFMREFVVRSFFTDGQLRSEVRGQEARHYPDDGRLEVDNARIRHLRPDGSLTTGQAQRLTSNAEQTEFVLTGQAVVVREQARAAAGSPRLEFRGEHLRLLPEARRVIAEQPVLLLRGRDRMAAQGLDYRDDTGVALFKGRAVATLGAR